MTDINIDELIEFRDKYMKEFRQEPKSEDRKESVETDKYNENKYKTLFVRNEFSKDRDRIRFSRAFRRLEHKAQIYTYKKGDHFRTRLTHTLEVAQIAVSLARNLNLNEDLVEAISLGHDIGHTPFGHQGERTLDKIMRGEDDLSGKIKYKLNYGGFKHNFHSLKILDYTEVKYENVKGMNLTWQVLEGILKHTKTKKIISDDDYENYCDLKRFIKSPNVERYMSGEFQNQKCSVTLEGQIVAIADEIAQRQHDIDDGLRDVELKISFEEIKRSLDKLYEDIISKYDGKINIFIDNLKTLITSLDEIGRSKNSLYINNSLTRNIINFFLIDVTIKSLANLKHENVLIDNGNVIFKKELITFSNIGKRVNDEIQRFINARILNSYNVNRFDGKAIYIVRQLFKAYYTNPRQMPKYILDRLADNLKRVCKEIYSIELNINKKNTLVIKNIDFNNIKPDEIEALLNFLKLDFQISEVKILEDIENIMEVVDDNKYIKYDEYIRVNNIDIDEKTSSRDRLIKAIIELHYSYLSIVCDYIAGMTDSFACSEFENLYLV